MADVDTGTAPLYREVLRRLLNPPEPVTIGRGYVNLGHFDGAFELCIDATVLLTEAEATALRELMETP